MKSQLANCLRAYAAEGVALAFSGGVDSTLLLVLLAELQAEKHFPLLAVYFHSVFQLESETQDVQCLAERYNVPLVQESFDPLAIPDVAMNPVDRCYWCKHTIMSRLCEFAEARGLGVVMEGSHAGDASKYRPGRRALQELGVVSPLSECGFDKAAIRKLSAEMGIPVASKPSFSCLATRFSYGAHLTPAGLARVAEGERLLRGLLGAGGNLRLRVFENMARIEIDSDLLEVAILKREAIVSALKPLGFENVSLDLEGFRSGSMDGAHFSTAKNS